jgi:oligopeptide transport system substrate-binding protein
MLASLASCKKEDDGSGYTIKFDINENPDTLDPQMATERDSLTIISNIYSGLLRIDGNGKIVSSVAAEYEISDDGLEYMFYLRDDVYWKSGTFSAKCTAYDFAFAFERLISPQTKSPWATRFYCIKNARAINSAVEKNESLLGVKAVDERTLRIELEYSYPFFAELLTTPAAAPCNEEFFISAEGRYGLSKETVVSNGAFYLYKWNFDKYSDDDNNFILRRFAENDNNGFVKPYGLNIFIGEKDIIDNFAAGSNHALILNDGRQAKKIESSGGNCRQFDCVSWGIVFNKNSEIYDVSLKKSLAFSINRSDFPQNDEETIATRLLPPEMSNKELNAQNGGADYNAMFKQAIEKLGKKSISNIVVLAENGDNTAQLFSFISQQWQSKLGLYLGVKFVSHEEMLRRIATGDYDIALTSFSPDYDSPSSILRKFTSEQNLGASNPLFNAVVTLAEKEKTAEKQEKLYEKAELMLLDDADYIPVAFQSTYFVYNNHIKNLNYNPYTGTIDFSEALYIK